MFCPPLILSLPHPPLRNDILSPQLLMLAEAGKGNKELARGVVLERCGGRPPGGEAERRID